MLNVVHRKVEILRYQNIPGYPSKERCTMKRARHQFTCVILTKALGSVDIYRAAMTPATR